MARVNRLIQTTLADLIPEAVKDPRVRAATLVSVMEVKATPDLRFAQVYLSVVGAEDERQRAVEALRGARGFLRSELGRRVRLKHIPELELILDRTEQRAARIEEILRELHPESDDHGEDEDE